MPVGEHRTKDAGKSVLIVGSVDGQISDLLFDSMTFAARTMGKSIPTIFKAIQDGKSRDGWYYFLQNDPEIEIKLTKIFG